MKRREFLKASLKASALAGLSAANLSADAAAPQRAGKERPQYYELRAYRLQNTAKRDLLDAYLAKAAIPEWNRCAIKPVGVFVQQERPGPPAPTEARDAATVFVLLTYPALRTLERANSPIMPGHDQYPPAAEEYLQAPKSDPAFERIESWLMAAFAGMPTLELPPYCQQKQARMFELRTYESYSEVKALLKVEMFNSGEIETMREVGLGPIFYGQALIGSNLPHLTYMLSAENQQQHDKHWDAFKAHPTWKKLRDDPRYADTVSKITNRFLVPAAYSQI